MWLGRKWKFRETEQKNCWLLTAYKLVPIPIKWNDIFITFFYKKKNRNSPIINSNVCNFTGRKWAWIYLWNEKAAKHRDGNIRYLFVANWWVNQCCLSCHLLPSLLFLLRFFKRKRTEPVQVVVFVLLPKIVGPLKPNTIGPTNNAFIYSLIVHQNLQMWVFNCVRYFTFN